jgi:hypothetical protein
MARPDTGRTMEDDSRQQAYPFDDLADDLYELGSVVSAAQYHGMVCGGLCGNELAQGAGWRHKCLEFLGLPLDEEVTPVLERVLGLADCAAAELGREDFGFALLLPPEDCELSMRAQELANWCEGFLAGLALAGQDQQRWQQLPEDLVEGLGDLAAMTQIQVESGDDDKDYMELFEYVRMVVLNTYAQLRLPSAAPSPPSHNASGLFGGKHKLH